jgi:hypothetical protein
MSSLVTVAVALVSLLAAVASGSNFRAADQVYLNVAGKVGNFKTDVNISNLSSDTVVVTMLLMQGANRAAAPPQTNFPPITLAPNERREIVDFFRTALGIQSGLGQIVFNACKQGADCTGTDQRNFRDIIVESRIYAVDAAGNTHGQAFPGLAWYSAFGSAAFGTLRIDTTKLHTALVLGLRQTGAPGQTGTFRTNLGFTNASQFSTAVLTARLFDKTGAQLAVNTIALGPLGQAQPALAAFFPGVTGSGLSMTVEQTAVIPTPEASNPQFGCTDGCPGFFTYASALDNGTDDPTTLEADYVVPPSVFLSEFPTSSSTDARGAAH